MLKKLLLASLASLTLMGCVTRPPVVVPPAPIPVQLTAHVNDTDGTPVPSATAYWDGGQSAAVDEFGRHTFTVLSTDRFGFCGKAPDFITQCLDTDLSKVRDQFFALGRTAPPPPVFTIPTGQVHQLDRSFADDRGKYLEFGATFFPTEWLYINDLARLKANLAFLAKYGANPRILLVVSDQNQWAHRYVNPASPDWATAYVETIKLAYSYGLRPFVTIFGDPCCAAEVRAAIVQNVINLTRDNHLSDKITAFEVANEHALADVAEMERYAAALKAVHPLVATSSGEDFGDNGPELVNAGHIATLFQFHPDRNITGDGLIWRPSRQPYGYRGLNIPTIGGNGEPRGRASSISGLDALPADEAANIVAADMFMTYLSGFAQYVLHDGSAVYFDETNDDHGHRYNNLADSPVTIKIFDTASKLHAWLPSNLADWNNLTHSDPKNNGAFAFATFADQSFDTQYHQCGMRAYTAYFGAHGLTVTLGQCSDFDLIGRADTATDVTVRALTGEVLETFTLAPNQHHLLHRYAGSVALDTWFHQ